ncbi:MAG: hypothetical protein ACYCPP_08425 [Nitrososphaerales archaeon]
MEDSNLTIAASIRDSSREKYKHIRILSTTTMKHYVRNGGQAPILFQ